MSLPPNPLTDPKEGQPPSPSTPMLGDLGPAPPFEPIVQPREKPSPPWSTWDLVAVVVFTVVAIFVFSMIALLVARSFPAYRSMSFSDLATNARIVVGAQAAAYPVVLLFIFLLVRTRSSRPFSEAIQWNWPGVSAPAFVAGGILLAVVIESLSRYLPIPKSLPMDNYFHDATSAYMMAAFGLTLAPLLEELFFRGLLYPLLRRFFGLVVAIVLTAVAFAAIHGTQLGYAWAPILSIFVVGVVFTVVRVNRNSVAASFLMHCGYNFALFGLLWLASDHYRHLEKVAG